MSRHVSGFHALSSTTEAFHLKSAVEQLGSNIFGLEGYYCLASVDIPYSLEDIATSEGYEQYARRELQNQIDIGVFCEPVKECRQ